MPCWRLFYHLVWATKAREPLIDATTAPLIEKSLRHTCDELNIPLYALSLMPDHVHLALSIPPRLAIADFIGRLKGASSYAANNPALGVRPSRFAWQAEYGILSFAEKALPQVVDYIQNQHLRHAAVDLWPSLERFADPS